jgi:uncharacterized protein
MRPIYALQEDLRPPVREACTTNALFPALLPPSPCGYAMSAGFTSKAISMFHRFSVKRVGQLAGLCLLAASLFGWGFGAIAQQEPTLNQVYEAAQAGQLDRAQTMIQQVLVAHPNSGKAHFVQAELLARQGQLGRARTALAEAEQLAPGLPFAKAEAVQHLRAELAGSTRPASPGRSLADSAIPVPAPAPAVSFPWGLALALGGGLIAFAIFRFGKRAAPAAGFPAAAAPAAPFDAGLAPQGGLNGPQTFGMGSTPAMAGGPAAYGPSGQPGYGQPAGNGLGSKVMGGLATGLAVGAGVMAAQAIGRNLMGDHHNNLADGGQNGLARQLGNPASTDFAADAKANADMGGQNFGVQDSSSWDDGGSGGGGSDWDN